MIISIDPEKKHHTFFYDKNSEQIRYIRYILQHNKGYIEQAISNIVNVEKLKVFSLRSGTRQEIPTFTVYKNQLKVD